MLLLLCLYQHSAWAVTAHFQGQFQEGKTHYVNINDVVTLEGYCEKAWGETRRDGGFKLDDTIQLDWGSSSGWLDHLEYSNTIALMGGKELDIVPGMTLNFKVHCRTSTPFREDDVASRNVVVNYLSGSLEQGDATVDYDTHSLQIDGTVDGGANVMSFYHDGKEVGKIDAAWGAGIHIIRGTLDISDLVPGTSRSYSAWVGVKYTGGQNWQWVKNFTITKALQPTPQPTWRGPAHDTWHQVRSDFYVSGTSIRAANRLELRWKRIGESTWSSHERAITPSSTGEFGASIPGSADNWVDGASYQVTFRTQRNGGAWSDYAEYRTFKVDRTAPSLSWEWSPSDGAALNRDLNIKGLVTDHSSGPDHGELSIKYNDNAWEYTGSFPTDSGGNFGKTYTNLAEGRYQIKMAGVDVAGNRAASEIRHYLIDRTAPAISLNSPAHNSWHDGKTVRVTGQISDALSGMEKVWVGWRAAGNTGEYHWVDANLVDGVLDHSLTNLSGNVEIAVAARDKAGNESFAPGPNRYSTGRVVKADTQAPTVSWGHGLSAGQTTWFKDSNVTLGGSASDSGSGAASGQYRWRSQAVAGAAWSESAPLTADSAGAFSGTLSLSEQAEAYEVQLRAMDRAGNASGWSDSAYVKVKTTPPVIAWASNNAITAAGTQVTVRARLNDAYPTQAQGIWVYWRQGNTAWQWVSVTAAADGSFSHTFTGLTAGATYRFKLLADDVAGNRSAFSEVRSVDLWQAAGDAIREFLLTPEAGEDLDQSGGTTPGDALSYRVRLKAAVDIANFQLSLTLPVGLERDTRAGKTLKLDATSQINTSHDHPITTRLNQNWTGQAGDGALLVTKHGQGSPDLKQGDLVVLDIPIRISAGATGTLSTQARAWAAANPGIVGEQSGSADIVIQTGNFPVAKALSAGIQAEGLNAGTTPLGTPFTYVVTLKALNWPMSGARIGYLLPKGLHRNGALSFGAASDLKTGLNPNWQGSASQQNLLASSVNLQANQQAVVRVPVKLDDKEVGELCSEIEAGAASVRGTLWQGHKVEVEIGDEDFSFKCPRPRVNNMPIVP